MREPVSEPVIDPREAKRERDRQRTAAARAALAAKQSRKIQLLGWKAVDPNSPGAIAVREWRDDLMRALGGDAALTPQKKALINAAAITMLIISRLDDLLLTSTGPLVDVRTLEVAAFVLQREALIDGLARRLKLLGLERKARTIHDLGEILSSPLSKAEDSGQDASSNDPTLGGDLNGTPEEET